MEEKKLTDDTEIDVGMIVTALKKCLSTNGNCTCFNCKFYTGNGYEECIKNVSASALDLIHSLQSENERLTEERDNNKFNSGKYNRALEMLSKERRLNAELQKQINEVVEILKKFDSEYIHTESDRFNLALGIRKILIPEDAVVLTKEEYEELKSLANNHCKYCHLMDLPDFETEKIVRDTTRKETAEKFAKETKQRLRDKLHRGKALHTTVFGKEYVRRIFKEVIDEICKELTEGK